MIRRVLVSILCLTACACSVPPGEKKKDENLVLISNLDYYSPPKYEFPPITSVVIEEKKGRVARSKPTHCSEISPKTIKEASAKLDCLIEFTKNE
jgi:hypothetical protein